MSVGVFGGVLSFTVNGFVDFLDDVRTFLPGCLVVGIDIAYEDGKHLCAEAELGRSLLGWIETMEHDEGIAVVHLDAAYRVTITIVFDEPEHPFEPFRGFGHVAIHNVRKNRVGGYGAVLHENSMHPLRKYT